jgi:hypothetical protein
MNCTWEDDQLQKCGNNIQRNFGAFLVMGTLTRARNSLSWKWEAICYLEILQFSFLAAKSITMIDVAYLSIASSVFSYILIARN